MFVLGCKLCEALSVINACVLYDAVFIHTQLFKKPHPQKKLSLRGGLPAAATQLGFFVSSAANDRLFFHNVDNLRPSMQPLKGEHCSMLCEALVFVWHQDCKETVFCLYTSTQTHTCVGLMTTFTHIYSCEASWCGY